MSNLLPETSNSLPGHKQAAASLAQKCERTLTSPSEARHASFPQIHFPHLQSVEHGMRKSTEAQALDTPLRCVVSVRAQSFLKWICKNSFHFQLHICFNIRLNGGSILLWCSCHIDAPGTWPVPS